MQQLFSLIMDHNDGLIFVKDEASKILYANKSFLEIYPPNRRGSIIGSTTVEDFAAEEVALWLAEDRRAILIGRS